MNFEERVHQRIEDRELKSKLITKEKMKLIPNGILIGDWINDLSLNEIREWRKLWDNATDVEKEEVRTYSHGAG